jgi:hypothetical protein
MYGAVADEAGTSEFLNAPDTWKVTPRKLEKMAGPAAAKAYEKVKADAAYVNPENGSILLEKYERKDAGEAIRTYVVLNNLGKALKTVKIESEI